jgi:hypothetical protein
MATTSSALLRTTTVVQQSPFSSNTYSGVAVYIDLAAGRLVVRRAQRPRWSHGCGGSWVLWQSEESEEGEGEDDDGAAGVLVRA